MLATPPVWGASVVRPLAVWDTRRAGDVKSRRVGLCHSFAGGARLDAARSPATRGGQWGEVSLAFLRPTSRRTSIVNLASESVRLCAQSYGTGSRAGTALQTALCSSTLRTISFTRSAMGRSCVSMRCPSCAALRAISA